jgi:antitoxin (DNA-binding transcriptional repressor) of toxin-antitoxin stability system
MSVVRTISFTNSKSGFEHILDAIERGVAFLLTRDDRPLARVTPLRESTLARQRAEAFALVDSIPARPKTDTATPKELIEEGRR